MILNRRNLTARWFPRCSHILPVYAAVVMVVMTFSIYIIGFHRIRTLSDAKSIVTIAISDNVDERCKIYNKTHVACLPNFFFIGASKSGTTSMVETLLEHPNIRLISRRIHPIDRHHEVHRFDRNTYAWSWKWLELQEEWASSPPVDVDRINTTIAHYTPHYLYAPSVPFDLKSFHPTWNKLKFLVMLRNPIARAWSSYWFDNSHIKLSVDQGFLLLTRISYFTYYCTGSIHDFMANMDLEIDWRFEY